MNAVRKHGQRFTLLNNADQAAATRTDQLSAGGIDPDRSGPGTTVVIGAARGIGAAIAERLAAAEWTERIVLADLDDAVDGVAEKIRATGADAEAHLVDVTDPDRVEALLAAAPEARRLAIVSGIFEPAPALEVSQQSFRAVAEVNLFAAFFLAQAYAREMVEAGGGAIVGVASIAARMPRMRQAAYCASKAGMRQALRVLGMEVADRGVRVNTVSPGATDTPMMRSLAGDHPDVGDNLAKGSLDSMRPRIPDGRVATPDDVAAGVAFLLSPGASHLALHDLVIDGGELLGM
jgi:2,3-dihydro-2,3-dihydroxybenzoate dehydrogenase